MTKNKKMEWVAAILALIGCLVAFIAPKYIETDLDLNTIGTVTFLLGLFIYFIFGDKEDKPSA